MQDNNLNNTNFNTEAHVPTARYGQYLAHENDRIMHPGSGSHGQLFRRHEGLNSMAQARGLTCDHQYGCAHVYSRPAPHE